MRIIVFKIPLPLTTDEYKIAQLWSVAETSRKETGGGSGVEVLENRPCEEKLPDGTLASGYYTKKIYHTKDKVPGWVRKIAEGFFGQDALDLQEEAWNLFPYCRTIITHPKFVSFEIVIESMHLDDRGNNDAPDNLCISNYLNDNNGKPISYSSVTKEFINIAEDKDLADEDPTQVCSVKAGRGPIPPMGNWWETFPDPMMCCYKLVRFKCKILMVQSRVENYFIAEEHKLFKRLHKQLYCWMDQWYGKTMEEIRELETAVAAELKEELYKGEARGYRPEDASQCKK